MTHPRTVRRLTTRSSGGGRGSNGRKRPYRRLSHPDFGHVAREAVHAMATPTKQHVDYSRGPQEQRRLANGPSVREREASPSRDRVLSDTPIAITRISRRVADRRTSSLNLQHGCMVVARKSPDLPGSGVEVSCGQTATGELAVAPAGTGDAYACGNHPVRRRTHLATPPPSLPGTC